MSQTPNPNLFPVSAQYYSTNDPRTVSSEKYVSFPQQRTIYAENVTRTNTRYLSNTYDENVVPERQYQQPSSGLDEEEMKRIIYTELRGQFEDLRNELLDNFTKTIRQYKASSRISNDEIQEIKTEISQNKTKFENLQAHIAQVNQKFTDINEHCADELDNIKAAISSRPIGGDSQQQQGSIDSNAIIQELEFKFQTLKQNITNDVQAAIKARSKGRMSEGMVSEMKEMKNAFEDALKRNFDGVNIRVKGAEEKLHDILKVKQDMMERTKEDVFAAFEQQGVELKDEVENLAEVVHSKCDLNQAKVIIEREVAKKIGPIHNEIEHIRQRAIADTEEIERISIETQERLENFDRNSRQQLAERPLNPNQSEYNNNAAFEKRFNKLSQESEIYKRTINDLKESLAEVQEVFRAVEKQAKTNPANNALVSRLEAKINNLQTQIQTYSSRAAQNQNQRQQQQQFNSAQKPTTTSNSYFGGTSSPFVTALKNEQALLGSAPQIRYKSPAANREEGLKSSGMKSQDKSYNQSRVYAAENLRSPYSPTHEISSVVRRPEEFERKLMQSTSASVLEQNKSDIGNVTSGSTSQRRYYGDPKVKDIIDDYHRSKSKQVSQLSAISATSFFRDNVTTSAMPTPTSHLLGAFGTTPLSPKIHITKAAGSGLTSPQAGGPSLSGAKSHANLLTTTHTTKLQTYQQEPLFADYISPNSSSKYESFKDQLNPHFSKSIESNLSMTYSTINPKFDGSRIDDFLSPQGSYRNTTTEEEKKAGILPKSPQSDLINLQKGTDQDFLSAQLLQNNPQASKPLPVLQQRVEGLGKEEVAGKDAFSSRQRKSTTSGADTEQFHDAVDYLSDFDMNEVDEANKFAQETKNSGVLTTQVVKTEVIKLTAPPEEVHVQNGQTASGQKEGEYRMVTEEKKLRHQKILAQINYFIHGKLSNLLAEEDDEDIYCNLDEEGYVFDEDGDYVYNGGLKVKLSPEEIEKFHNNNMIESEM